MSDNVPCKILVAIDFGTTFSAVAWCLTSRDNRQYIIKEWPNSTGSLDGRTSNEVPTILIYDSNEKGYRWGYQIGENEKRIERFKLGLHPQAARQQSYLNLKYPDALAKAPEVTQKPEDLVRDYLKKLHEHIIAHLKTRLGQAVVDTTPIEYVLTVPAIWDDKAKESTKVCALAAGFGESIHMITEPEAAVTFALDTMDPGTLSAGDTFVLVDGGGGTGDLTSYVVEALGGSVQVREAAPGSGALCGSSCLNQIFRQFMIKRFEHDEDWDDEVLKEAMRKFENWTKRDFRGEDGDFIIDVGGLQNNPQLCVKRGKLRLTLQEMIQIFEPVVSVMTTLVQNQINATKAKVKSVLLVGGFGQNPFLKRMVQDVVGAEIEVLQPPEGDVAVVRGALIRGLAHVEPESARIRVSSRVARRNFGLQVKTKYDKDRHGDMPVFWNGCYGEDRVKVNEWFVKQGDIVQEDQPVVRDYTSHQLQRLGRFPDKTCTILSYESTRGEAPPILPGSCGVCNHVRLTASTSKIPQCELRKHIGRDGKKYYRLDFEIRINFFSAHTEYSLWHKDKCYGKARAEYE